MQFHTKCCGRTSPSSPQPIVCLLLRAQFRGQRLPGPRSFPPKLELSPSRKGTNSGVSSGNFGKREMTGHETHLVSAEASRRRRLSTGTALLVCSGMLGRVMPCVLKGPNMYVSRHPGRRR
ncbi:hypothetical protein LZ32DRAFT_124410 [Colletotrichum eremochloae]|nr:hypothetical protein LZ32DRAFT_124410 [Colletotrichum eremochloae]